MRRRNLIASSPTQSHTTYHSKLLVNIAASHFGGISLVVCWKQEGNSEQGTRVGTHGQRKQGRGRSAPSPLLLLFPWMEKNSNNESPMGEQEQTDGPREWLVIIIGFAAAATAAPRLSVWMESRARCCSLSLAMM